MLSPTSLQPPSCTLPCLPACPAEEEANAYFQRVYAGEIGVEALVEVSAVSGHPSQLAGWLGGWEGKRGALHAAAGRKGQSCACPMQPLAWHHPKCLAPVNLLSTAAPCLPAGAQGFQELDAGS